MQYKVFFNPNESTASRGLVRGSGNQEVILKRRTKYKTDIVCLILGEIYGYTLREWSEIVNLDVENYTIAELYDTFMEWLNDVDVSGGDPVIFWFTDLDGNVHKTRWADTADLFESKKSSKKRVREDRDAATQIISSLRRLSVCTSAAARNPEGFSAYMEGFGFSPEELEGIEELLDEIYVNWSENAD